MHRAFFPSTREYTRIWGIDARRVRRLPGDALLMHPGPVNRGVELTSEAMDDPRSVITEQVTNGIAVRMACLYRLLAGSPRSEVAQ
jgi:aspartate carbamoyltransferase catalytic subunit